MLYDYNSLLGTINIKSGYNMTEQQLENNLLEQLQKQNYNYRPDITDIDSLNQNFRKHLNERNSNKLQNEELTNKEFENILIDIKSADVYKASQILRDEYCLQRDNGDMVYLSLFNSKEYCTNNFEVINQLSINQATADNPIRHRYDVILLINGLPLVHIELKRDRITPRRALEQISNYKKDNASMLGTTLLCFTQIYIIATESLSYYCVNNNLTEFQIDFKSKFLPVFSWADDKNNKLNHLITEFTPVFLDKCFISKMIARYIVLIQTKRNLMILRPYQVHAVEAIVNHLHDSYKNGYVWHTTGSGKTLTSFKCATILRDEDEFDKILFVVDRKDLDKQTVDEFNKFEPNCVDKTKSTKELIERLASDNKDSKVIVTTLQKLSRFLEKKSPILDLVKDKKIVFIFDECHRSQFGESNKAIRETFENHRLIGFTGTPIFEENASASNKIVNEYNEAEKQTTEHIFDLCLHRYLIKDAIDDNNVLSFHVDYYKELEENISKVQEKKAIAQAVLDMHPNATRKNEFNAIFAVSSIKDAIAYYAIFKDLQKDSEKPLSITAIFSPPPSVSSNYTDDLEDEKKDYLDASQDQEKAAALQEIIDDYNKLYKTSFNVSTSFDAYYDEVSQKVKNHNSYRDNKKAHEQIHLLIVVDMFLTGFDSPFTNSLFIDKELRYHSLIQAFSRTNRVVNNNKKHGNIYCFTDLQQNLQQAIKLFSYGHDIEQALQIWQAKPLKEVQDAIIAKQGQLETLFKKANLPYVPASIPKMNPLQQKEFIEIFQEFQKEKNAIVQYMGYDSDMKTQIEALISADEMGSFRMHYIECVNKFKDLSQPLADDQSEDLSFDTTLEIFKTEIVDWEYIVKLVNDSLKKKGKEFRADKDQILAIIRSDPQFYDRFELVNEFYDYQEQNQFFKGVTESEISTALNYFALDRLDQEWTKFKQENPVNLEKFKLFSKRYDNFKDFDETLFKQSLIFDNTVRLLEKQKIQQKHIDRVQAFLYKYDLREED